MHHVQDLLSRAAQQRHAVTITARCRCGSYSRLPGTSEPSCRCRPADYCLSLHPAGLAFMQGVQADAGQNSTHSTGLQGWPPAKLERQNSGAQLQS